MSILPARHSRFDDAQGILTGALVVALGIAFVKSAGLLTGGTVGIAFLIHYATGMNFGLALFCINLPFYWLAAKRMGIEFTLKTLATVLLVSLLSEALPQVFAIARIDPFFAGFAGGLLMGVGMLILFRHRASLGGLNVLVLWLQERSGWRAGKLQMAIDVVILLGRRTDRHADRTGGLDSRRGAAQLRPRRQSQARPLYGVLTAS